MGIRSEESLIYNKTIKSNALAKRFYLASINYLDSCKILENNFIEGQNPLIIYPLIYLERHTLELVLKSLILSEVNNQKITSGLTINILGNSFDLSKTHSLDILIEKYYSIQIQSRLITLFDDNIDYYKTLIKKYDNYDRTSEFYRYPITKIGKYTPLRLWREADSDIAMDISKKNGSFIFNFYNDKIKHVCEIDQKAIFYQQKFIEMIDYYMNLSPFCK